MNHTIFSVPRKNPPLGAVATDDGVYFAVASKHAERIDLCLFDESGIEIATMPLPDCVDDIWQGFVPSLPIGTPYGFRAHGPYAPKHGHRFNPAKLLLDPYARAFTGTIKHGVALSDHNDKDSAPFMLKSVVTSCDDAFDWSGDEPLKTPWSETVIYEAHVKGLTMLHPGVPEHLRGTYEALGCAAVLDHLTLLGITAIELLPIHAFIDDAFLEARGLCNYWGYNTVGYFVPESRYMGLNGPTGLKAAIKALHGAGIEAILDVVYNHTAEADDAGPTLHFRGLDNATYYRHAPNGDYINDTGCGNTVDLSQPIVSRLVIDSLRYWVDEFHIDGFRFDLAPILGRDANDLFDAQSGFLKDLMQDPILQGVKLIAEPWDIGPGGYQVGNFPTGFSEWNDQYRDDVRRFWRGDVGTLPGVAARLMGSADKFDHSGRAPTASLNFITAHDGFTLRDTVSHAEKHNEANGENNHDGHDGNHSSNSGVEGSTDDPLILAARQKRCRNLLSTLFLSQGVPMIWAGDEVGHSQNGNNNAYCQDNPITWVNWTLADTALLHFTQRLIALRREHAALRQPHFLHGEPINDQGDLTVDWIAFETTHGLDWENAEFSQVAVRLRTADDDVLIAINGGNEEGLLDLPNDGTRWQVSLTTDAPDQPEMPINDQRQTIRAASICVYTGAS